MLRLVRQKQAKAVEPIGARFGLRLKSLAAPARIALETLHDENADLRRRLAEAELLADHDSLTPTLNRRAFMRALHQAMSYAERYETPAAVLYVDLDAFKAVNDRFGHGAGDAVLRHVAQVLRAQVRESDVVGRLGGDEFGVILARSEIEEARRKAQTLAEAIAAHPAVHEGVTHRIGASIGVHALGAVEDPESALARADEAMYAAKHARARRAER